MLDKHESNIGGDASFGQHRSPPLASDSDKATTDRRMDGVSTTGSPPLGSFKYEGFPPDLLDDVPHGFPVYQPPIASARSFPRPRLRYPPSPPRGERFTERLPNNGPRSNCEKSDSTNEVSSGADHRTFRMPEQPPQSAQTGTMIQPERLKPWDNSPSDTKSQGSDHARLAVLLIAACFALVGLLLLLRSSNLS